MDTYSKQEIDLSCEVSCPQYFKSSFARSMAVDCMNQSKSLDNAFLDRSPVCEKGASHHTETATVWTSSSKDSKRNFKTIGGIATLCKGNAVLQNECDLPYITAIRKNNRPRSQTIDAAKLWKTKQVLIKWFFKHEIHNIRDHFHQSVISFYSLAYIPVVLIKLRWFLLGLITLNKRLELNDLLGRFDSYNSLCLA